VEREAPTETLHAAARVREYSHQGPVDLREMTAVDGDIEIPLAIDEIS
jgi:hypothetical protein